MSTKCGACGGACRKGKRAHILSNGRIRPGRVCLGCARLGWLLVLGSADIGERAPKPPKTPRRMPHWFGETRAVTAPESDR